MVAKKTKNAFRFREFDATLMMVTAKNIKNFLGPLRGKKIAVIADNDQDGLTAAVEMKFFLDSQKAKSIVCFYDHYSRELSYPKEEFIKFNPEKTIFLDLSDGFVSELVGELGNSLGPFISIDHHQREVIRGNAFKSLVVKPNSFSPIEPSKYPTSKMVFDLFGGVDWICVIGIIGDFAHDTWVDFLARVRKKYKLTQKKLLSMDDVVACVTSQYPEKINSLFELMVKVHSPNDLLSSEFVALKKLFDAKLKTLENLFDENAECFDDMQICFFKSDPRFSSRLSNIISQKHKSSVVIVYEQPFEQIKCSIRRQDFLVNCGELAKFAVQGFPDSKGGGHIPAAGAQFPPQYLEKFKERARLYLLENPPKKSKLS